MRSAVAEKSLTEPMRLTVRFQPGSLLSLLTHKVPCPLVRSEFSKSEIESTASPRQVIESQGFIDRFRKGRLSS
jgi:hypothetical protein